MRMFFFRASRDVEKKHLYDDDDILLFREAPSKRMNQIFV